LHWNFIDSLHEISLDDLFWANALVNSPALQVKIVSLQPLAQHWPHFGMPLVNPLNSIAVKAIFESV
jgi:hypothetical protein